MPAPPSRCAVCDTTDPILLASHPLGGGHATLCARCSMPLVAAARAGGAAPASLDALRRFWEERGAGTAWPHGERRRGSRERRTPERSGDGGDRRRRGRR